MVLNNGRIKYTIVDLQHYIYTANLWDIPVVIPMSVVKLSKSGKAILFIDDFGNVFMTSKIWVTNMLEGKSKGPFLLLKRMPDPVSVDRFMRSPVLEFKDDGTIVEHESEKVIRVKPVGSVRIDEDSLSKNVSDSKESEKIYSQQVFID